MQAIDPFLTKATSEQQANLGLGRAKKKNAQEWGFCAYLEVLDVKSKPELGVLELLNLSITLDNG